MKTSRPNLLLIAVSLLFSAGGIAMIRQGESWGWPATIFFGVCFVIAIFEPKLRTFANPPYTLLITADDIACEHPRRTRESIRWDDIIKVWYVTTSHGPRVPDEWILLEGAGGGCSFPTEAEGMAAMWDEFKNRFPGFDYGPLIKGGTTDAKHLCWERKL